MRTLISEISELPAELDPEQCYCGKLQPDGTIKYYGTISGVQPEFDDAYRFSVILPTVPNHKNNENSKYRPGKFDWAAMEPRIIEMLEKGMFQRKIAEEIGCGQTALQYQLRNRPALRKAQLANGRTFEKAKR